MRAGVKLSRTKKKSVQTTHSSPNLFTQPSQFTAMHEEELPKSLNQIRQMRAKQEENLILIRARLQHLINEKERGDKRITHTHQDIDNIIQQKTKTYIDR